MRSSIGGAKSDVRRTDRDLPLKAVLFGSLVLILVIWVFLDIDPQTSSGTSLAAMFNGSRLLVNLAAAALIVLFGFLFVTVSSRLTGEIGSSSNPISGMTIATLLLTCLIFLMLDWTAPRIGYWRFRWRRWCALPPATAAPRRKTSRPAFSSAHAQVATVGHRRRVGIVVAGDRRGVDGDERVEHGLFDEELAATSQAHRHEDARSRRQTGVSPERRDAVLCLARRGRQPARRARPQISGQRQGKIRYLVDPGICGKLKTRDDGSESEEIQSAAGGVFAMITDGILSQKLPWVLVLLGVAIALVVELCGVSSLAFAVGVYLPLSSSAPISSAE